MLVINSLYIWTERRMPFRMSVNSRTVSQFEDNLLHLSKWWFFFQIGVKPQGAGLASGTALWAASPYRCSPSWTWGCKNDLLERLVDLTSCHMLTSYEISILWNILWLIWKGHTRSIVYNMYRYRRIDFFRYNFFIPKIYDTFAPYYTHSK